ncbi:MAG: hypothetical protein AB7S38_22950 [Vulcanimicrobiota bacterium]
MQPLPPAGFPLESYPLGPTDRVSKPAAGKPAGSADRVEFGSVKEPGQQMPQRGLARLAIESPRPWPPTLEGNLTAWGELSRRVGRQAAGQMAFGLLPQEEQSEWDARPTTKGWQVPKNPNRTPVRPRPAYEVSEKVEELGPLEVVASNQGRIRALRLQWPETFVEPALSAQRQLFHDLLTRLSAEVVVHVVAEGQSGDELRRLLAKWSVPRPERVHIHPMVLFSTAERLYSPLTMWARDGALLTRTADGRAVLLLPRTFRGDGQVDPALNRVVVQGSGAAPARLQEVLPDLLVRRSCLSFEGGDVVASGRQVLVGGHSVARTMTNLGLSKAEVVDRFGKILGREAIVIEPQPDFHLDLGFTFLDDDTVAVADPKSSMAMVGPEFKPLVEATKSAGLAESYERAAEKLRGLGLRVVRLPNLAGVGLLTPYLTYNNVLMECYDGVRRVYMPVYGVSLDEVARAVYREYGFEVVDMPSAQATTRLWGAVRCATGELEVSHV